ncbi:MAG: hypothetical protein AAGF11_08745 [Myxococcota bacterium]
MGALAEVPPVGVLLGFEAATSPLVMLVEQKEQNTLWSLTVVGAEITDVARLPARRPTFADRQSFLEQYDVGRCVHADQDCLFLSKSVGSREISVYREPLPGLARTRVRVLNESVRDVAYVEGSEGRSLYVLTNIECSQ